jgi:GNAT superfamily N-acetyltransferase
MLPTFPDLSAKAPQVQANMIAYWRLFAGLPGMLTRDDAQVFSVLCAKPDPGDIILRANWNGNEAEIEGEIDALYALIAQQREEINWLVFPTDQPPDLNQRLEARGMPGGRGGNWLWADLAALVPSPTVPRGFHIELVRDDRGMAEWIQVSEAGFNKELSLYSMAYTRHGYGPEAFSLHYIAYLENTPVSSGTLLDAGGSAAIWDLSTPPALRHKGFGSALMHAMLGEIRARGYGDTWIWASDIGRGVYQQLGYVDVDFGVREHHWQK